MRRWVRRISAVGEADQQVLAHGLDGGRPRCPARAGARRARGASNRTSGWPASAGRSRSATRWIVSPSGTGCTPIIGVLATYGVALLGIFGAAAALGRLSGPAVRRAGSRAEGEPCPCSRRRSRRPAGASATAGLLADRVAVDLGDLEAADAAVLHQRLQRLGPSAPRRRPGKVTRRLAAPLEVDGGLAVDEDHVGAGRARRPGRPAVSGHGSAAP